MSRPALPAACVAIAIVATAAAQETNFSPEQVRRGAEVYALNCSPCHGPRLYGEESAFDLRKFPRNERERFINSVTRGKNQMPPWGGLIKPEEIEALWAYVNVGER
jgi:mono/diheme cytochrome c family protein